MGGGGRWDERKADQKIVISYVAITLKCFFTQIFTQILLASIVEGKEIYFL